MCYDYDYRIHECVKQDIYFSKQGMKLYESILQTIINYNKFN